MLARKAEPVRVWQSAQWQMVTLAGSTSASKVIRPQWQCPSIFMGSFPGNAAVALAERDRPVSRAANIDGTGKSMPAVPNSTPSQTGTM
jgi:hypothetical protein